MKENTGKKKRKAVGYAIGKTAFFLLLLTALLSVGWMSLAAPENLKSDKVRSIHVKNGEIENSTLIIGSHLIHISALTDELYQIAMQSASEFSQNELYYKSELSGGSWYLITAASSIEDISTAGTPVDSSVIEALEFTHHTKSDGVTYDLRSNQPVSAFDINPPYNLEAMEELEPLRLQYQLLTEKEEESWTDSDLVYQRMIADFFKVSIRDGETDEADESLRGLQSYRNVLAGAGAESSLTDEVDKVMASVDAGRRIKSLTRLAEQLELLETHAGGMTTEEEKEEKRKKEEIADAARDKAKKRLDRDDLDGALNALEEAYEETRLDSLIDEINDIRVEKALKKAEKIKPPETESQEAGSTEPAQDADDETKEIIEELERLYRETKDERLYNRILELGKNIKKLPEDNQDTGFLVNADIVTAIGQCIQNVEESILKQEGKRISEGNTVASKVRYRYAKLLEDAGKTGDMRACDTGAETLCDLTAIADDRIADRERELLTLDGILVAEGATAWRSALAEGVSESYRKAESEKSSRAVLSRCLEQQQAETNSCRLEYQGFVSAKAKRMNNGKAQEYLLSLIDGAAGFESAIPEDEAASRHRETVAEYLAWLKSTYAKLVKEAEDDSDMDRLKQQEEALRAQKQDALDNNDLAGAKKLDAAIEAKNGDIDALTAKLSAIAASDSASESEKAKAAAALGEGNTAAVLSDIASRAAQDIRDGSADSVKSSLAAIDAMKELDSKAAAAALTQVQDALSEAASQEGEDSKAMADAQKEADALAAELAGGGDGNGENGSSGDGTGSGQMDAAGLKDFLEELLGAGMGQLSGTRQAAVLLALEWRGKRDADSAAAGLAGNYAAELFGMKNPYLFEKLKGVSGEYVPLETIAGCLSYRYIFDDTKNRVTLQRGSVYYRFTAGEMEYGKTRGERGQMKEAAVSQGDIYIPEEGCMTAFSCDVEYILLADYGLLTTVSIKEEAKEIYAAISSAADSAPQ